MPKSKYQKDANGLYYAYVKTGLYNAKGAPEYKKLRGKTIAKLDEKIELFKKEQALGLCSEKITVDEWEQRWFAAYKSGTKETTRQFYQNIYRTHISPSLGRLLVSQVSEAQCQAILTAMADAYSVKTIRSVRTTLFSIFDKARANRLIAVNPCEHLTAQGRQPKSRRALTAAERSAYLHACTIHELGTFAAFLYFFGLRRGEALALTGADIFPDHIRITKQLVFPTNNQPQLDTPKSAAGVREIPIPQKARKYIDFDVLPRGYLFVNDSGAPFSYSEIIDRWRDFLRCAFGKHTEITMHYLRHNYCTMLFENDVDLQTVKQLAGHESIETTLHIYTHYSDSISQKSAPKVLNVG